MKEKEKKTIYYLCDGKRKKCEGSKMCYRNGGECSHTGNIEHAVNFQKQKGDLYVEERSCAVESLVNVLRDGLKEKGKPIEVAVEFPENKRREEIRKAVESSMDELRKDLFEVR